MRSQRGTIRDLREQRDYGLQIALEFTYRLQRMYASFYAYLSPATCAQGEQVREGQILGYTGKTGNARTLPAADDHLHFEIRLHNLQAMPALGGRIEGELLGSHYYCVDIESIYVAEHRSSPKVVIELGRCSKRLRLSPPKSLAKGLPKRPYLARKGVDIGH
jgi:murein DD-endopeptidase MepM/ murein hydrolase activator NlpD